VSYQDADPKTLTSCCEGLDFPRDMPYLHGEKCPERERTEKYGEPLFYREDPSERASFDRSNETFSKKGEPKSVSELTQVVLTLDTQGRMSPYQGSYARMSFVQANAVMRAQEHIKHLYALLNDARDHLSNEGIADYLVVQISEVLNG
jgi:hypothetical protein